MTLKTEKVIDIRFSEVDSMKVVWHGSYPLYFEDAREAFGREHGLSYDVYIRNNVYAPLVDLDFHYKRPLRYGQQAKVVITYVPTDAAKIIFDYEIRDNETGDVCCTGRSVQVFMDLEYQLLWSAPEFYEQWKKEHLQ